MAQLYVRIGFFYKVIRNMATEKLQVQKVPIEISIPNSTLDAWIQRGLGGGKNKGKNREKHPFLGGLWLEKGQKKKRMKHAFL